MSLDKKGFAEIVESAISECKTVIARNGIIHENGYLSTDEASGVEYKYNKYIEKLTLSKIKRLYSILSVPAYSRIMSMSDKEIDEYREDKIYELSCSINRLMLAMEVSKYDNETLIIKNKVGSLVEEQTALREMTRETLKKHVIDELNLSLEDTNVSFDGKEETEVLENIIKDKDTLTEFINMVSDYRELETEIKKTRAEQIIIYNDLFNGNVMNDVSIDELFSEESLSSLQATIGKKLNEIGDAEVNLKRDFGSKAMKNYYKIKSVDYKSSIDGKKLPYEKGVLETFEEIIPSRTIELANLQNDEWVRLNKKMFKTSEVNSTLAVLSMEIDETKNLIDSFIRDWYKNAYYSNPLFGPVSSRASGRFEYSLGAKNSLGDFVNYGVWPEDAVINSLRLCLKLNRIEAEKTVIYAEQIKERLSRLFNSTLNSKKKELEDLDLKITSKFGNWKNEVILSIVNEVK